MAEADAIAATDGLSFRPAVEALLRWFVPARTPRIQNEYAREQTDYVLAALDREDVDARLDVLSGDDAFWRAVEGAWEQKPWQEAEADLAALQIGEEGMSAVLGVPATTRFFAGFAALKSVYGDANRFLEGFQKNTVQIAQIWAAKAGAKFEPPPAESKRPSDLAATLYDPSVPAVIRQVVASMLRWMAAFVVLARVRDRADRLEPWLALELAERTAAFPERTASILAAGNILALAVPVALLGGAHAQRTATAVRVWGELALASDGVHVPEGRSDNEGR